MKNLPGDDTLHGDSFEATAAVVLDGRKNRGCCKAMR
jgi:hypothetical protein